MDIQVGDRLTLKKPHPCGSHEWEVLRIGADFRLKCAGCGHQIMCPRSQVEKKIRRFFGKLHKKFRIYSGKSRTNS